MWDEEDSDYGSDEEFRKRNEVRAKRNFRKVHNGQRDRKNRIVRNNHNDDSFSQ
jgi:hypothetical protein